MVNVKSAYHVTFDLLWPSFIKKKGCLFLKSGAPENARSIKTVSDRTEAEALFNHIHILDCFKTKSKTKRPPFYVPSHPDFLLASEIGRVMARLWFNKLRQDFPQIPVRVYFTQYEDPIVRFHVVREDEPVWLDEVRWSTEIAKGEILVFDSRNQ
jgi:hypothetical protein